MSGFATFETKVVIKTSLSFLGGEFLDLDSIHLYGIGVFLLLGMIVISIVLEREE